MEEIKDLGGLVNKDTAFNKMPENAVYDSQNFRILTTEGASTGARENIKGTIQIAQQFGLSSCLSYFNFDFPFISSTISAGTKITIGISLTPPPPTPGISVIFPSPSTEYTYSNNSALIQAVYNFLVNDSNLAGLGFTFILSSNIIVIRHSSGRCPGRSTIQLCVPPTTGGGGGGGGGGGTSYITDDRWFQVHDSTFQGLEFSTGVPGTFYSWATSPDPPTVLGNVGYLFSGPSVTPKIVQTFDNSVVGVTPGGAIGQFHDPSTYLNFPAGATSTKIPTTPNPTVRPALWTRAKTLGTGILDGYARNIIQGYSIQSRVPLGSGPIPTGNFGGNMLDPNHPFTEIGKGPFRANLKFYLSVGPYTKVKIKVYVDLGLRPYSPYAYLFERLLDSPNLMTTYQNEADFYNQKFFKINEVVYTNATNTPVIEDHLNTGVNFDCLTLLSVAGFTSFGHVLDPNSVTPDIPNATWNYHIVVDIEPASPAYQQNNTYEKSYDLYLTEFTFKVDETIPGGPGDPGGGGTGGTGNPTTICYTKAITVNQSNTGNNIAGQVIGWTTLRDDIYLITTDGTFNPDDPSTIPTTPTVGQIWKLSYNKAGNYADPNLYQLQLIHSSQLNLTIHRPIANPGMIESRYENKDIQKIYWTDNYNPPRQINVADPNAAYLLPEQLNLQTSLSMDLPKIVEVIDGGNLMVGVYQVAYRLKNSNGAESRFSRTSNSIPIIDASELSATVEEYFPTADIQDDAGKSIRVRVDNLDLNYDIVEFVTIYYPDNISVPDIYIVKEVPLQGPSVEIIISGTETKVPITLDEFTAFNTVIKRAKTLAATKQTLFLGNVTLASSDLTFDARAYRFPHPTSPGGGLTTQLEETPGQFATLVYDSSTNSFTYNGAGDVPENANCIQSYQAQTPNPEENPDAYLYQPGTNILGGKGPNVTYEFVCTSIELDVSTPAPNGPVGSSFYLKGGQSAGPHYVTSTNPSVTFGAYSSLRPSRSDYGSPYTYDIYKGYRRDEMYRFGIVFFDELDNPTFVKWIADIRMPHIYMPDNAATATSAPYIPGNGLKRSRQVPGSSPQVNPNNFSSDPIYYQKGQTINNVAFLPKLYAKPLGIKFTIDFSTVPDRFKKAAIVRVALDDNTRHIYGQGLFLPTFETSRIPTTGTGSGAYKDTNAIFLSYPFNGGNVWYDNISGGMPSLPSASGWTDLAYDVWTFRCPEHLFKRNFSFENNDSIDVVNVLHPNPSDIIIGPGGQNLTANNIASDRTYLQILDGNNQLKPARAGTNITESVDYLGDQKYLVAWKTKYYYSVEMDPNVSSSWFPSASVLPNFNTIAGSVPMTMKNLNNPTPQYANKNPYPVIAALDVTAGFGTRDYTKGTLKGNSVNTNTRTVHACTPRNLNAFPDTLNEGIDLPVLTIATTTNFSTIDKETKYIHSYTNDCLVLQLFDASAKNFASEGAPFSGSRYTKFDRLESTAVYNQLTPTGDIITGPSFGQYLANYKKNIVNPFGGQDFSSRASSEYILCNNIIDISSKGVISTTVYGGDTAISVMDYVIQFPDRIEAQNTTPTNIRPYMGYHVGYIPVETNVALEYRRSFNNTRNLDSTSGVPNRVRNLHYAYKSDDAQWEDPANSRIEAYEYFKVDSVFNHDVKTVYRYYPRPIVSIIPDTFDCRVMKSETKTDGESTESWSVFRPDARLDVESAYGPINNLIVFQGKLYYFQDRGFGLLQVNDQKLIADPTSGADLVLGSSGILERYDYISTKTGTKHQFSMSVSDSMILWFDTLARKMYRFKPSSLEPLSDVKGYSAIIYNKVKGELQVKDNPYIAYGIHSTYDYRYNEFYMTFLNGDPTKAPEYVDTIVYNEFLDGYTGSYTHYPKVYINDKVNIFSIPTFTNPNTIHVHNQGAYGSFYNQAPIESKVSVVINSNPTVEKTFTNLELVAEAYKPNTFVNLEGAGPFEYNKDPYQYIPLVELDYNRILANTAIRVYDTYQNTDWRRLFQSGTRPIARKHKTIWNIKIPTDRVPYSPVTNLPNIFQSFESIVRTVPGAYVTGITKRFKDKWFVVDFAFDNSSNTRLLMYTAKAIYSLNSR